MQKVNKKNHSVKKVKLNYSNNYSNNCRFFCYLQNLGKEKATSGNGDPNQIQKIQNQKIHKDGNCAVKLMICGMERKKERERKRERGGERERERKKERERERNCESERDRSFIYNGGCNGNT